MSKRIQNILLCVFLSLLIVTLLSFSFSYGRFFSEQETTGGNYGSDLEYIVSNQIEVGNMEEFISAIQNGYTNIKISDDASESIVITTGVTDVGSDLIINLNGHQLVRNSREPMLNIQQGVHLTIIDSSPDKSGSFYNPVGSVLQIDGGTLTVSGGTFESGPRTQEYLANGTTERGGTIHSTMTLPVHVKEGGTYSKRNEILPVILPRVTLSSVTDSQGNPKHLINGNVYLGARYNYFLPSDTFLCFTVKDPSATSEVTNVEGSADFVYSYYIKRVAKGNSFRYDYTTESTGENVYKATVYGYNNVVATAQETASNFAAVRMMSGNLYLRGGAYHSYFGVDTAYCVSASGGYMSVERGDFTAMEEGVCISCSYSQPMESEFLNVSGGNFYSEVGDTIHVSGGKMTVFGGNFRKDASKSTQTAELSNNAIIGISGENSTLEIDGVTATINFNVVGSGIAGIRSQSTGQSTLSINNATLSFANSSSGTAFANNRGIYLEGGTVTATDCTFDMQTDDSFGIRCVDKGSVNTANVTVNGCVFKMSGLRARGVSASFGQINLNGSDKNNYSLFYIEHISDCYGVYTTALNGVERDLDIFVNKAQFFMGQSIDLANSEGINNSFNGAGVYSDNGKATVHLGDGLFICGGDGVSGVYAEKGSVVSTSDNSVKTVLITGAVYNDYQSGISHFPKGGNEYDVSIFENNDSPLNVTQINAEQAHGIYVTAGTVSLGSVFVAVYGQNSSGIVSYGGNITVNGRMDIAVVTKHNTHQPNVLRSTALGSEGGSLTFNGDAYIVTDSLGIYASNGNVTAKGNLKVTSSRGTSVYVDGGSLTLGETGKAQQTDIVCEIDPDCSWRDGAGYSDAVLVLGGSLFSYGTLNITHKGLDNEDQSDENSPVVSTGNKEFTLDDTLYREFETKSFAIRVQSSATSSGSCNVVISEGTITNDVGGGVFVNIEGNSADSAVVLGKSDSQDLTVTTKGVALYGTVQSGPWYKTATSDADNWAYLQNKQGGPAVEVRGGTLTIYGGTYTAAQGEGVLVKNGSVDIYGGTFVGADAYNAYGGGDHAGPAASYAFKVFGGQARVYDGTFGTTQDRGSGAFVMGTSSVTATAEIYGGTFKVSGQAGFSVCEYADLLFDPNPTSTILVSGNACGIAVENRNAPTSIVINGGTFESTGQNGSYDGVWFSNTQATMTITGGTFIGSGRSGLYFQLQPEGRKVQIYGGTFNRSGNNLPIDGSYWEYSVIAAGYRLDTSNPSSWQVVAN